MRTEHTVDFMQFQVVLIPKHQVMTQTKMGTMVSEVPERVMMYGLDYEGQLWLKDNNIPWSKVTHPERQEVVANGPDTNTTVGE